MNPHFLVTIYPIWIGIGFNLLMTTANFAIEYRSPFGQWYFERKGGEKIMIGAWSFFIGWAAFNGLTYSP